MAPERSNPTEEALYSLHAIKLAETMTEQESKIEETPENRSNEAGKRPHQAEAEDEKSSKPNKQQGSDLDQTKDDPKESREEMKRAMFERIWSQEDEIALLEGLIRYSSEQGNYEKDINAFHDFIKKSLCFNFTAFQVQNKIMRLKKIYRKIVAKSLKKGKERCFKRLHDKKMYDLSKIIWGSENPSGFMESTGMPSRRTIGAGTSKAFSYPFSFDAASGFSGTQKLLVQRGLKMIEESKRAQLEEKEKKLMREERKLHVQKLNLVKEQAILTSKALETSDN